MRLHDHLDRVARESPDLEFVIQGNRTMTYGQAYEEANRLANALIGTGLEVGDRFGYLAENSVELLVAYLAASKSGAVPVPLNYRLAPAEWRYILDDAKAVLVVARGEFASRVDAVRADLPLVTRWISIDHRPLPGWVEYASWVSTYSAEPPERAISPNSVLFQMYTSGTTGSPKGALLTHRAILSNAEQCRSAFSRALEAGERLLLVMPIFHAGAVSQVVAGLTQHATIILHEAFNPGEVVKALDEEKIAVTTLVPAMIQACLLHVPGIEQRRFAHLRMMFYGASPIAEDTLRRAMAVFHCDFCQAYGMTEVSSVLTLLTPEDHQSALAGRPELLLSAGRSIAGTELRIADAEDNPLPPGAVGQVLARGPQLMDGYWQLPDASARALAGGWMHTGDIGLLDAEGYLYLKDRVHDMIVSGGENIYPREVENALFSHPAVGDAAVIGIPDDRFGESVLAFVVVRGGHSTSTEELVGHCRALIAKFKVPRRIEFMTELPRNPSGKVLKRLLREPFWKDQVRRVH